MSELSLLAWLIAYSFGIVCIVFKTINYYKKLETIETIYVQAAFLLLVISFTLSEYYSALESAKQNTAFGFYSKLFDQFILFSSLLISYTCVVWMRSKKNIVQSPKVDRILRLIFFILLIIFVFSSVYYYNLFFTNIIMIALVVSIIYALVIHLVVPSKYDNVLLDKLGKIFSIGSFVFLPGIIFIDIFYNEFSFIQRFVPYRFHTVSIYYPFLCFFEILESIIIGRRNRHSMPAATNEFKEAYGISPRESEVLQLLIKGKSYQDIAEELFISLSTVKTHISKIYKKTSVINKVELIHILTTHNKNLSA